MNKKYLERMDKSKVSVRGLEEDALQDTYFWLSKTPTERLIGLELLRMRLADYDNTRSRLQRLFTVTERPQG